MNITVLTYDTLDSTNTEALKQARLGADEGLCIVARQQTAGRGRHGRTWVSEKDAGLYFSIVLRPKIEGKYLPLITLMAGIAVHDMLQEIGLKPDIKWVNDVLVDDKKISGILAETTETNEGLAVVLGIGINIKSPNFPPEIADIATSIEAEPGAGVIGDLTEALTKYITYFYDMLHRDDGPTKITDEWGRRSTYFFGRPVRVNIGDKTNTGITEGLEPNGALRVRSGNGDLTMVQAGEVESLREDQSFRK